jgi:hypothetical protein
LLLEIAQDRQEIAEETADRRKLSENGEFCVSHQTSLNITKKTFQFQITKSPLLRISTKQSSSRWAKSKACRKEFTSGSGCWAEDWQRKEKGRAKEGWREEEDGREAEANKQWRGLWEEKGISGEDNGTENLLQGDSASEAAGENLDKFVIVAFTHAIAIPETKRKRKCSSAAATNSRQASGSSTKGREKTKQQRVERRRSESVKTKDWKSWNFGEEKWKRGRKRWRGEVEEAKEEESRWLCRVGRVGEEEEEK